MKLKGGLFFSLFVLITFLPAGAVELSISENRGEIGTVGFVDIDEIFKKFPETQEAKKAFKQELEKNQVLVDKKKKELFAIKSELIKLKEEKMLLDTYPKEQQDGDLSTLSSTAVNLPGYTFKSKTENQTPEEIIKNPQDDNPYTKQSVQSNVKSTDDIIAPKKNIEIKIQNLEELYEQKQIEFKTFVELTQKKLSKLEEAKKQKILAKIYEAIKQAAIEEHISVVVRKQDVLFGQKMVDLTGKVIKKLGLA
jgi:Skp family chaperone for outer membrane proteins